MSELELQENEGPRKQVYTLTSVVMKQMRCFASLLCSCCCVVVVDNKEVERNLDDTKMRPHPVSEWGLQQTEWASTRVWVWTYVLCKL